MPFLSGSPAALFGAPVLWGVDLGDVITVIVVLAIIVLSGLMQLMGKAKQGQQPARGRQRPGRAVRAGQPRRAARPAAGGEVDDEIADFLRRAAQRRQPPPAQRPARPKPAAGPRAAQQAQVVAELVAEPRRPTTVAEHVRHHLDTSGIAQEAAELGSDVTSAEREMEQHLKETFSQGMSGADESLAQTATQLGAGGGQPVGPSVPSTSAAGLAALLADTNNVRQAIVLSEILTRPVERWT